MVKCNTLSPVGEKTLYPTEEQTHNAIAFQLEKLFRCYNSIKGFGKINIYNIGMTRRLYRPKPVINTF
jgi:hypothetical protein